MASPRVTPTAKQRRRARQLKAGTCLMLLGLLPLPTLAEEAAQPAVELLEFLGTWEDADGEWIDPLSLLQGREDGARQDSNETTPGAPAQDPDKPDERGSGR